MTWKHGFAAVACRFPIPLKPRGRARPLHCCCRRMRMRSSSNLSTRSGLGKSASVAGWLAVLVSMSVLTIETAWGQALQPQPIGQLSAPALGGRIDELRNAGKVLEAV